MFVYVEFTMLQLKSTLLVVLGEIFIAYGVSATVPPCVENRTETCIQNLDTFTILDKPRFASETELERLCREAEAGQRCSSDFLRTSSCISSESSLPIQLKIGRSQEVSQMLCSNGGYITNPTFRKLYLKHEACIDEHQRKIKECHTSSGIMEDPEFEIVKNSSKTAQEKHMKVCCPLVQYIECTENAIGRSCGTESKEVVRRVLLKTSGKQVENFCKNEDPNFPNSPEACMNSSVQQIVSLSLYYIISVYYFAVFLLYIIL